MGKTGGLILQCLESCGVTSTQTSLTPEVLMLPRSCGTWIHLVQDPLGILRNEQANREIDLRNFI